MTGHRIVLTPASEIEPEPVVWAWEDEGQGRIPAGALGLFAGREGTGKSSALIWLAGKITRGELPGAFYGQPRSVIYVAVEDSWRHTLVPRLMAAGADRTRVYRADVLTEDDERISLSLPADIRALEEQVGEVDAGLIVLDPLLSVISDRIDTHKNAEVRRALEPMAALADRTGLVIGGVAHFNKGPGSDPMSLITGSGAFREVARYAFAFAADPDAGGYVLTQSKNSLGRSDLPSLAYRIVEAIVPTAKGEARVGRFVLDGQAERSVTDLLSATEPRAGSAAARACDWLRAALAGGPRRSNEIEADSKAANLSERTMRRARSDLGILTARRDTGPADETGRRRVEWWSALPEHESYLHGPFAEIVNPQVSGNSAKTANTANGSGKAASPYTPDRLGSLGILPGQSHVDLGSLDSSLGSLGSVTTPGSQTAKNANLANNANPANTANLPIERGKEREEVEIEEAF